MNELQRGLERPFPVERLHWRCGARTKDKTKGVPLAYIDARDVMRRLDEVCGFDGWQNKYTLADSGLLICDIGIRINEDEWGAFSWLWRSNGAGDTQVEAEKGKASDAFKRAAVMWGVGRYLYNLPNEWLPIDEYGKFKQKPTLPKWATPEGWDEAMGFRDGITKHNNAVREHTSSIASMKELFAKDDFHGAYQCWSEIPKDDQEALWLSTTRGGVFTTEERAKMKSDEWNAAMKAAHAEAA